MIAMLRIIFIFGIIYLIYRFLIRYLFPLLLGEFINRNFSHMHGDHSSGKGYQTRHEGDITIDNVPPKGKHFSKNTGEYVDYEEIK